MNLLGAVLYDPGTAASKATSALLAMTAFDTTNLRATVTVPAHGKLRFRIFGGAITGATTLPTILIGFLSSTTVIARVTPRDFPATMNATTQTVPIEADFTVTGLTPGSITLDLAYAVQVIVASTTIKYGGPNTNAGANAWGAMCFEIWDPQPLAISSAALLVDSGGLVSSNLTKVNGTAQTAKDLGAQLDATVSSRMATYTQPTGFLAATFPTTVASPTNITSASGIALAASQHVIVDSGTVTTLTNLPAITAGWLTATGIAASALNGKGDWNVGKTGYSLTQTFPTNFSAMALTVGGAVTAGTVSDKTGYSLTTADWAKAGDAMTLTAAYDAAKTALAASSYTAPDNTRPTNFAALLITAGGAVTAGTVSDKTGYALSTAYDPAKTAAQAGDAMALTAGERLSVADAHLNRDMSLVSDTNTRTPLNAFRFLRNKWALAAGVLTVSKEDDATSAWTAAVTSTPGADPVTGNDPT